MATEVSDTDRFAIHRPPVNRLAWSPLLVLLSSCAGKTPVTASVGETLCVDPRPQVCTMDYLPVCAALQDGTEATYPNACGACADTGVRSHRPGICE